MASKPLHVIALISGGKDSFFSVLHCIQNGHRIVALANLYPATDQGSTTVQLIDPTEQQLPAHLADDEEENTENDLNSFMYQTVGHEVIPLYAAATGLPLYRQPILGGALRHERDYDHAGTETGEETESMIPLLQAIMARHPEANALCAGAILSTYQRTRVESIALRLGLVPLAYLWKYPVLPPPSLPVDDTQLLKDMAAAGLDARIIKVASAGLNESHLWERVSSQSGADRIKHALRKFGTAEGAALGEGGEFETLVLDGPAPLFSKRIVIPEKRRRAVHEGGGTTWLMLRGALLEDKLAEENKMDIRTPDLLDSRFQVILESLSNPTTQQSADPSTPPASIILPKGSKLPVRDTEIVYWSVLANESADKRSIESEIKHVVKEIRKLSISSTLNEPQTTNTIIILRDMADFPKVNAEYGKLFPRPNPPSRVTISCGDLLPAGCNIAIHLAAPISSKGGRNGLHVQSQSYWAPANIGPYSQAIDVPITYNHEPIGLRAVSVAGQIPLMPASMSLPPPSDTSLEQQIVLSLQHLWRIGSEVKVQYWTSAVAYFSRTSSESDMKRNSQLSGRAWELIHAPPVDEDDAQNDIDPWDLKYNHEHISLSGGQRSNTISALPDWDILTLQQQNEPASCIPPLFAVEVEGLPRQSSVEWHAHIGLSHVEESSSELLHVPEIGVAGWSAWHMIVRGSGALFLHFVLSCNVAQASEATSFDMLRQAMNDACRRSLQCIGMDSDSYPETPYLAYLDAVGTKTPWSQRADPDGRLPFALIPCRSIWSPRSHKLGFVAMYKSTFRTSDL